MAIIEELGLEVSVYANGAKLPEYDDPDFVPEEDGDSPTKASQKYVQSIDNAEFKVRLNVERDEQSWIWQFADPALCFYVHIDGHNVKGTLCFPENCRDKPWTYDVNGVHSDIQGSDCGELRKFKFAPVATVDEADKSRISDDVTIAKDLGTIRVEVIRQKVLGPSNTFRARKVPANNFSLSEKALKGKAISHGTSYSSPVKSERRQRWSTESVDPHPIAVFNFKYRSKEALQRELIIPRSRRPSPSGMDDMSPEQIRRLARERLGQLNVKQEVKMEGRSGVKREITAAYDLTGDDVVPMPVPKAAKREGAKASVVDLTDY